MEHLPHLFCKKHYNLTLDVMDSLIPWSQWQMMCFIIDLLTSSRHAHSVYFLVNSDWLVLVLKQRINEIDLRIFFKRSMNLAKGDNKYSNQTLFYIVWINIKFKIFGIMRSYRRLCTIFMVCFNYLLVYF